MYALCRRVTKWMPCVGDNSLHVPIQLYSTEIIGPNIYTVQGIHITFCHR